LSSSSSLLEDQSKLSSVFRFGALVSSGGRAASFFFGLDSGVGGRSCSVCAAASDMCKLYIVGMLTYTIFRGFSLQRCRIVTTVGVTPLERLQGYGDRNGCLDVGHTVAEALRLFKACQFRYSTQVTFDQVHSWARVK
ncbi:hypothetical protein KCU88_g202, partial [Aureobasidium melanogenum]